MQEVTAEDKLKKNISNLSADHDIDITIYTDPLCCWSWAFQPQLDQLYNLLNGRAKWQYRMGGLIPTWKNFHDEVNHVSRPVQMGPVWMHAGQVANLPIYHQVWMKDPPASSYPSCIAVKAVQLQSEAAGTAYLMMLRKACMSEGKNIAKDSVLFSTAKDLVERFPDFNYNRFITDYEGEDAKNAFRVDLDLVKKYNINRFPTLIIKAGGKAIMIAGYRQHQEVMAAIQQIVPGQNPNPVG